MQRRAILALLLIVGALAAALWLRNRGIEQAQRPEEALFPAFDPAALAHVEVHHLERGTEVVLESDASGRWYMTEPVPYPAEAAMVQTLRGILSDARGLPLAAGEGVDLRALGLDPPRIVVVWRAGAAQGRLEVGAEDVDGARLFARADGRVLRAGRALARALELNPDDYRDRALTELAAREATSFRRSGALRTAPGGPEADLALDALLDPQRGWVSPAPLAVALDPVLMGYLVRGAAELRAETFESDGPTELARFGLDRPRLRVELEGGRGERAALLFGCRAEGPVGALDPAQWYACREGDPFVWTVEPSAVALLSTPASELYDTLLLRAQREEIERVELGGVALVRAPAGGRGGQDGEGAWLVSGPAGEAPADADAVSGVLAALEFARFSGFDSALALGEPRASLAVVLRDGRRLGGELGADLGGGRVALRRFGDELVGTAGAELYELARTEASALRSKRVHALEDVQVAALRLAQGERSARFERDLDTGRWRGPDGAGEPGHAFYTALERLLYLEARAWLDGPPPPLAQELRVAIERTERGAAPYELVFGADAEGRAVCVLPSGGGAAEVDHALYDDLRALLQ